MAGHALSLNRRQKREQAPRSPNAVAPFSEYCHFAKRLECDRIAGAPIRRFMAPVRDFEIVQGLLEPLFRPRPRPRSVGLFRGRERGRGRARLSLNLRQKREQSPRTPNASRGGAALGMSRSVWSASGWPALWVQRFKVRTFSGNCFPKPKVTPSRRETFSSARAHRIPSGWRPGGF